VGFQRISLSAKHALGPDPTVAAGSPKGICAKQDFQHECIYDPRHLAA
jgi:hypothetical protein